MKSYLMNSVLIAAVLLLSIVLGGCTSMKSLPKQLPETIRQGAATYERIRPVVVDGREKIKANWSTFPPDVQKLLTEVDAILPQLDEAGRQLVLARDIIDSVGQADGGFSLKSVDWDTVLSVVLKAASTAVDLKAKGVI